MKTHKIIVAIPSSHAYLWLQTCVSCLIRNPPKARGYDVDIIVVDNSRQWSPAIYGLTHTRLGSDVATISNHKSNKFHASALDCIVETFAFDYLLAMETDVLVTHPDWLQWLLDQMRPTDYAVGHWHHESFISPCCTLYNGNVLREMMVWCHIDAPQDELRWGNNFEKTAPLDNNLPLSENPASILQGLKDWICGPFAEKRGFREGTRLKESPSGQLKGPGWYEPGQQLHHWAVNQGYTYTICPTLTTNRDDGLPLQTMYGPMMVTDAAIYPPELEHTRRKPHELHQPDPKRQLEANELFGNAYAAHMWGGTRALDILKHAVTCGFVKGNTPYWLAREARFWREVVPQDVQEQTLDLIRKYGFHITGQGNNVQGGDERDREAAQFVKQCYREGGVVI